MVDLALWEMLLLGVILALVLIWVGPGIGQSFKRRKGEGEAPDEKADWGGLLFPIGLVVLFVLLLIMMV